MTLNNVFIGIGSNLGDPVAQVQQAVKLLAQLPNSKVTAVSSLYASSPVGPQDQPDFINAVAQLKTQLKSIDLLDALQALEQDAGRVRKRHWGERTLDLDVLLYNQDVINHPRLIVPHPEMRKRRFVLLPLLEIAPTITLPDQHRLAEDLPLTADQEIWQHSELDLAKLLAS